MASPGIALSNRLSRSPDILMVEVDGETVLMSVANGAYYGLAATARTIWWELEAPIVVRDLLARLGESYSGDGERMAEDTLAFLQKMEAARLIVVE